mmetsp:Transcript_11341/g.33461  ORF Transcript_11341/g.33461 Transcript_11341/m.33461 type:complete len:255 (-) Transcript_11341:273-1037(-)
MSLRSVSRASPATTRDPRSIPWRCLAAARRPRTTSSWRSRTTWPAAASISAYCSPACLRKPWTAFPSCISTRARRRGSSSRFLSRPLLFWTGSMQMRSTPTRARRASSRRPSSRPSTTSFPRIRSRSFTPRPRSAGASLLLTRPRPSSNTRSRSPRSSPTSWAPSRPSKRTISTRSLRRSPRPRRTLTSSRSSRPSRCSLTQASISEPPSISSRALLSKPTPSRRTKRRPPTATPSRRPRGCRSSQPSSPAPHC